MMWREDKGRRADWPDPIDCNVQRRSGINSVVGPVMALATRKAPDSGCRTSGEDNPSTLCRLGLVDVQASYESVVSPETLYLDGQSGPSPDSGPAARLE